MLGCGSRQRPRHIRDCGGPPRQCRHHHGVPLAGWRKVCVGRAKVQLVNYALRRCWRCLLFHTLVGVSAYSVGGGVGGGVGVTTTFIPLPPSPPLPPPSPTYTHLHTYTHPHPPAPTPNHPPTPTCPHPRLRRIPPSVWNSMMVRSEMFSPAGERRVAITRTWIRADPGLNLIVPVTAPRDADRPAPTTRHTNPLGGGRPSLGGRAGAKAAPAAARTAPGWCCCACMCVCVRGWVYVCMCVCVYVCMCACVHVCASMCVRDACKCVCVCSGPPSACAPHFYSVLPLNKLLCAHSRLMCMVSAGVPSAPALLHASFAFLSVPLTTNYSGQWRIQPDSVTAFSALMSTAKVSWLSFKGAEPWVLVQVWCPCAGSCFCSVEFWRRVSYGGGGGSR